MNHGTAPGCSSYCWIRTDRAAERYQDSMSSWQKSSWLDSYTLGKCFPVRGPIPSVLHISQAELCKGGSQLQGFLKAAHILAGGLGRHILATAFTIHQA